MLAPTEEPLLPNPFARIRSRWSSQSRARRELLTFAGALALGLLLLPWLIWIVGHSILGPYAHGGALRFFGDFLVGLTQGSPVFWVVALGPTIFLLLIRLFRYGVRAAR